MAELQARLGRLAAGPRRRREGLLPGRLRAALCRRIPLRRGARWTAGIVAFANLWTTPDQSAFSMDLMRYADDAPKNVMDFLFVELLHWGRAQGYRRVRVRHGAAGGPEGPAAGADHVAGRPASCSSGARSSTISRACAGTRTSTTRSGSRATSPPPHKWSIPILLADVGLLSSGGVSGLTRRKGGEAPRANRPNAESNRRRRRTLPPLRGGPAKAAEGRRAGRRLSHFTARGPASRSSAGEALHAPARCAPGSAPASQEERARRRAASGTATGSCAAPR